jgi:hypothetical protein
MTAQPIAVALRHLNFRWLWNMHRLCRQLEPNLHALGYTRHNPPIGRDIMLLAGRFRQPLPGIRQRQFPVFIYSQYQRKSPDGWRVGQFGVGMWSRLW